MTVTFEDEIGIIGLDGNNLTLEIDAVIHCDQIRTLSIWNEFHNVHVFYNALNKLDQKRIIDRVWAEARL